METLATSETNFKHEIKPQINKNYQNIYELKPPDEIRTPNNRTTMFEKSRNGFMTSEFEHHRTDNSILSNNEGKLLHFVLTLILPLNSVIFFIVELYNWSPINLERYGPREVEIIRKADLKPPSYFKVNI